jgi:hypothetical protein
MSVKVKLKVSLTPYPCLKVTPDGSILHMFNKLSGLVLWVSPAEALTLPKVFNHYKREDAEGPHWRNYFGKVVLRNSRK